MGDEESLVSRRPRRSTAGNRMELALAEIALEEPQEPEEDVEFIVDKEEEDIFESDFASTDEEAAQEGVEEGDRSVQEEERRERKTARSRVEKATAAAHARQRATFNPETVSLRPKSHQKAKRRVSLGVVVNAETGEVIEGGAGTFGAKRHSQRRHTVMNTSATVSRIKDAEVKRAAIPKKIKTITRLPTQDELIARALDTEEGNIQEHRNYLQLEEEKRAKARVVKQSIQGPVLRWISKKETIQVEVQIPQPPPIPTATTSANMYAGKYSFVYTSGMGSGSQPYSIPFYSYTPLATQNVGSKPQEVSTSTYTSSGNLAVASSSTSTISTPLATHTTTAAPANVQDQATPSKSQQPQTQLQAQPTGQMPIQSSAQPLSTPFPYASVPPAPIIAHRTEQVCKNYVIHEISQSTSSKPPWRDTMTAMFGDHVKWDEVKVFTGKGRPLARPVRPCPITGQPAKYRDPRTNAPFSDVGAYNVLTRVLGREYIWSGALGCYVGEAELRRGNTGLARDSEENGKASAVLETGGGNIAGGGGGMEGNLELEGETLEERNIKRRKIGITEG